LDWKEKIKGVGMTGELFGIRALISKKVNKVTTTAFEDMIVSFIDRKTCT
jgi:hypothetical protein